MNYILSLTVVFNDTNKDSQCFTRKTFDFGHCVFGILKYITKNIIFSTGLYISKRLGITPHFDLSP